MWSKDQTQKFEIWNIYNSVGGDAYGNQLVSLVIMKQLIKDASQFLYMQCWQKFCLQYLMYFLVLKKLVQLS